jgi:hypothetical protein
MNHQAYTNFKPQHKAQMLLSTCYEQHPKMLLEKTKTKMQLAFEDQRRAGALLQSLSASEADICKRITWSQIQRTSYQVIEECRDILSGPVCGNISLDAKFKDHAERWQQARHNQDITAIKLLVAEYKQLCDENKRKPVRSEGDRS